MLDLTVFTCCKAFWAALGISSATEITIERAHVLFWKLLLGIMGGHADVWMFITPV